MDDLMQKYADMKTDEAFMSLLSESCYRNTNFMKYFHTIFRLIAKKFGIEDDVIDNYVMQNIYLENMGTFTTQPPYYYVKYLLDDSSATYESMTGMRKIEFNEWVMGQSKTYWLPDDFGQWKALRFKEIYEAIENDIVLTKSCA